MQQSTIPTKVTVYRVDQEPEEMEFNLAPEPHYHHLKSVIEPALGGGGNPGVLFFERVRVFIDGKYTDMFVIENSAQGEYPLNQAATDIYRNNALTHDPSVKAEDMPAVYGPAVLFDRPVWF